MTNDAPSTRNTIAIFITDDSSKYSERFGDFAAQSADVLRKAGETCEIQMYDNIKGEYPTEEELELIKGIWITGSVSDSFADIPWINKLDDYIKFLYNEHPEIRLLGICFGHQIIGRALGAKVGRNPKGWEYGTYEVKINDEDEDVREFFGDFGKNFKIREIHQDVVMELPAGLKLVGSTEKTKYQGFYKKNQLLTFQGHPEFSCEFCVYSLKEKEQRAIMSPDDMTEAKERVLLDADDAKLGKLIVSFFNK